MRKYIRVFCITTVVVIILSLVTPVFAEGIKIFDDAQLQQAEESSRGMERQTSNIVIGMVNFIVQTLGLSDIVPLVYMKQAESIVDYVSPRVDNPHHEVYNIIDAKYKELYKALPSYLTDMLDASRNNPQVYKQVLIDINNKIFPFEISDNNINYRVSGFDVVNGYAEYRLSKVDVPPQLLFGLLPPELYSVVSQVKDSFNSLAIPMLAVAIAVTGFLILVKTTSTAAKYVKEVTAGILLALVILKFSVFLIETLGDLNTMGVNIAFNLLSPSEMGTSFLNMLWKPNTRSLGMAIISFMSVFMIANFNFQYNVRLISLCVLFSMTPVMAVMSIFPSRKEAVSIWASELVSNIFMQTCHAFALTFYLKILNVVASSPSLSKSTFWIAMAGLMSINSIYMLVRSMMGLAQFNPKSAMGVAGNAMGLGAMLGLARMGYAMSGKRAGATDSLVATSESPLTTLASKAIQKMPEYSPLTNMLTQGAVKGGKLLGGAAFGLAGGLIMAASGQDASSGIMLGAMAGSKLGGTLGRGAVKATLGAKDFAISGKNLTEYMKEKAGLSDDSQYYDVQEMVRMGRNLGGASGEVVGEIAARFNISRAQRDLSQNPENLNPDQIKRIEDYNSATALRGEKSWLGEELESNKERYAIQKTRLEATKANMGKAKSIYGEFKPEYSEAKSLYDAKVQAFQSSKAKLAEHEAKFSGNSQIQEYKDTKGAYDTQLISARKAKMELAESQVRLDAAIQRRMSDTSVEAQEQHFAVIDDHKRHELSYNQEKGTLDTIKARLDYYETVKDVQDYKAPKEALQEDYNHQKTLFESSKANLELLEQDKYTEGYKQSVDEYEVEKLRTDEAEQRLKEIMTRSMELDTKENMLKFLHDRRS